ncbi:peptide ABC transporter ATP-binding protein [Bosea thiooxidans]|uniref:Peptide ABC transporter ATP-binding protein n=1 Tax=Bosea thiooxidans TaxID=53254 RepID=A0A0Q3PQ00_9HYPH|nr:ABC transporter ATP-binding protein [Bosea thiooxidans]KQK31934.1 peptide ABC transporter ATP-binding protein [Bosea thiooxidans]SKB51785.1 peptide/nickel transport system ATP-binding protein [Bosea thiooxidans]
MTSNSPILTVEDLRVGFPTPRGTVEAVRGISFAIGRNKVGIVGESGSGKSMTGRAILKLLPGGATSSVKSMKLGDTDLAGLSESEMLGVRGKRISMILQDPKYSLNPVMRVGHQIAEAFRVHHRASKAEAEERALEMLAAVRIRDPRRVFSLYPHEVSGGMGQRIMIAMMLIPEPELIIADEPTSALDVTVRLQVLAILDELVTTRGIGLMFISHDLNLVSTFCDEVLIMYAGRIVERCPAAELHQAKHPYTRGLLASLPRLEDGHKRLRVLERDPSWRDEPIPAEA